MAPCVSILRRCLILSLSASLFLGACGANSSSAALPDAAGAHTPSTGTDLPGVRRYLLEHTMMLTTATRALNDTAAQYYELAKARNFDYAALWSAQEAMVAQMLLEAKRQWQVANPAYEQMEGLVAGVPALAQYDVILDSGAAASDDPGHAVPFDLTLPNGTILKQPGNFFYLTETALWGTRADFIVPTVRPDLDRSGSVDFGEVLPEANFLLVATAEFDRYAHELADAAQAWQPTVTEAFTALVVMTPTMSEFFESWKNSRFIAGAQATEAGFVGASRLSDAKDILQGLNVIYAEVQPLAARTDAAQSAQIAQGLRDLQSFVADLQTQEQQGRHFTSAEADLLGTEAQNRATAITGQLTQAAARLGLTLPEA